MRLRLTSNSDTPREFIEELLDDEDVARAAGKAVNELDDEDD